MSPPVSEEMVDPAGKGLPGFEGQREIGFAIGDIPFLRAFFIFACKVLADLDLHRKRESMRVGEHCGFQHPIGVADIADDFTADGPRLTGG